MSVSAFPSFELTGRKVFLILTLFFGTIASADAFLIVSALRSWAGAETTSAYKAGQLYNAEIALARAQNARGWVLDGRIERTLDGTAVVRVEARDDVGRAVERRTVVALLQRPTDKRGDRSIALRETSPGFYEGAGAEVAPGQWDLVLDVMEGGERAYRRKTRLVLR